MKKILLLTGLIISLLPGVSRSSGNTEYNHSKWKAVRQYFIQQVLPVLNEKRTEFDAYLNESERKDVIECRQQLYQLKDKFHKTIRENSDAFPERSSTMLTEEIRQQRRMERKELLGRIQAIANNHADQLDEILAQLSVQGTKWIDDISKLLDDDFSKGSVHYLQQMLEKHQKTHYKWGRTLFLLIDPSKSIAADSENKIAAGDILPSSGAESMNMFPNPAIGQFNLNLENIPSQNKLIITDMEGKTMLEKENLFSTETIDCSSFPTGIYFVQLRSGDEIINKKLIINR